MEWSKKQNVEKRFSPCASYALHECSQFCLQFKGKVSA